MADYTNGSWHAMTLGQLISIMVDSGSDPAVLMRVANDEPVIDGSFIRHLEVIMIPNGRVVETINGNVTETVHKVLMKLIESGLVK